LSPLTLDGIYPQSAGLLTKTTPDKMYHSNIASISVYNPQVGPHQYSSASVAVEAGDGPNFNQIQVGWIVSLRKEKKYLNFIQLALLFI